MKSDARFPTTQQTWLRECLAESTASEARSRGLRDAREHVMRRYYEPLAAYLGATSYRDIDAPSALVAAFFVDRFGDDTYLQAWKASGLPLRRWLVNGLLFWLRTEVRRRRREERRLGGAHELSLVEHHAGPDAVFEREWARSIVGDACEVVAQVLQREGESQRWVLFCRHVLDGLSYGEIATAHGCDERDVRNACRLVRSRLEEALLELLRDEGVSEARLESEVARIRSHFVLGEGA
jgi:DNA-directed RNA polymerase specialized sigma24 family protein